jgi:hypothetical protein
MDGRQEARALLDPALDVRFPQVGVVKGDTRGNLRRFRAALREIAPDLLVTRCELSIGCPFDPGRGKLSLSRVQRPLGEPNGHS